MKKNYFFLILLFVSILGSIVKADDDDHQFDRSRFAGYWIKSQYYNLLTSGSTPFEAFDVCLGFSGFKFSGKENMVQIGRNFHEAWWNDYKVIANDRLVTVPRWKNSPPYTFQIKPGCKEDILLFINGADSTEYIKIPNKYSSRYAISELLNKLFVAGQYKIDGNVSSIVTLFENGLVKGLDRYTNYEICFGFIGPPRFDYLILKPSTGLYANDILAWEMKNDTLILFKINEEDFKFKIGTVYRKLVKIDQ